MRQSLRAARGLILLLALAAVVGPLTPRAAAQVSGTVRDALTSQPIAGARVSLQASPTEATTDANGAFSLPTVTGTKRVIVAAKQGFYYAAATVDAPQSDVVLALALATAETNPDYQVRPPLSCSTCHSEIYAQWADSPMARSGKNTWVYDVYDGSATAGGMGGFVYTRDSVLAKNNPASECGSCHQPERWWSTPYVAMDALDSNSDPVVHGVSCDICHKVAAIDVSRSNFPGLWPGVVQLAKPVASKQVMFGVLGDVTYETTGQMQAAYNPQLRADVCAACHQDKNDPDEDGDFEEANGVVSEPTYQEWKESPYADPADPRYRTCVDCHMKAVDTAQACSVQFPQLQRPLGDVRSHAFPGTTAEFLDNAVSLGLTAKQEGSSVVVEVTIDNDKTGHHVPTGVTIRNMILLVDAVTTSDGRSLAFTGTQIVDPLGGVGDPAQGYFAGLPGKLFAKVNGDASGKGPTFFTDAASILWDTRIPPLGSDKTRYAFAVPGQGGELHVSARLIYRRSWRALVDAKKWDTDGHGGVLEDLTGPSFGHLMAHAEQTLVACGGGACESGCGGCRAGSGDASLALLLVPALLALRRARLRVRP